MNNEIKITLIASVIIFAGIGFLAQNTINSVQTDTQPSDLVINQPSKKLIASEPVRRRIAWKDTIKEYETIANNKPNGCLLHYDKMIEWNYNLTS